MSFSELTPKRRLLGAIAGEEIDRIPWSPFLAYYWEHLPNEVQAKGQVAYLREMGADPLLRGAGSLFISEYLGCDVRTSQSGRVRTVVYETPAGTLTEQYRYSKEADSWFLTDHPVQDEADFHVLQYLFEHTRLKENYEPYQIARKELGEGGLIVPVFGTPFKTPFQELVEHWCGTVELTYALYDFPEVVEECLSSMETVAVRAAEISAASEAEAFIFWEDSSTTNISPEFFRKYTAPTIEKWGRIFHDNGKYLIHHACGHIRDLLPLMNQLPIDMVESISPPPTGNIDIADAFGLLGKDKGLIGGIEPVFFKDCTIKQLEDRVHHLLEISKGRKYILANSDSCPPGVEWEKFYTVGKMVREHQI